ncbi:MAG TPA: HYR domain-containing protein [Planctomycetota bacterium]
MTIAAHGSFLWLVASTAGAAEGTVAGPSCVQAWLPTFGSLPGLDGTATALAVFDDGSGPALYVGGDFSLAGAVDVKGIARWDGAWSYVGSGANDPFEQVRDLVVHDDGTGPQLYACGLGPSGWRVARWDGASWDMIGSGANATISALAVFDAGGGAVLVAAGHFTVMGGNSAPGIARWNGLGWLAVSGGLDGAGEALEVFDDGGGPALFVGGEFTTAGGVPAQNVARWDGSSWSALGAGTGDDVDDFCVYDEGSGPALFAAGVFTAAGGAPASRIARWDGAAWSPLGAGLGGSCDSVTVFDDGAGPKLYASGFFTSAGGAPANGFARWDGVGWEAIAGLASARFLACASFDDGSGPALYGAGTVTTTDGATSSIARWNGAWSSLGSGLAAPPSALASHDDGSGAALYAGGAFVVPGLGPTSIARWDGATWSAVGNDDSAGEVLALCTFDDGGGPALYAGGDLTKLGGVPVSSIGRWDGASWAPLGLGTNDEVHALCVYDDGSGPVLVAGGRFTSAGGGPANRIARWNGGAWSGFGAGANLDVRALVAFDDGQGDGTVLYAGGRFSTMGGVSVNRIARWDGAAWSSLAGGANHWVHALAVFDDGLGDGPVLYAAGPFTAIGGVPASHVARWDGSSWSAVGGGVSHLVNALAVFDDSSGSGPALYAGGVFTAAGGNPAARIARWDGTAWAGLALGLDDDVLALGVHGDGSGPGAALYVAGQFPRASDALDAYLARWQGCPDTTPPELACPTRVLAPDSRSGPPGRVVPFAVQAVDALDPSPTVVCTPPSGSFFPRGTTLVTCTATDAAGNQSSCQFEVVVQPRTERR